MTGAGTWLLAMLVGVVPRFVGDAGIRIDVNSGVVTGYDSECICPIDSLLPPQLMAADLSTDRGPAAFDAERFVTLPSGHLLASLRVSPDDGPEAYVMVTFDTVGTVVDAIYGGVCDRQLRPVDFEAADRFGNTVTFMTGHNIIPPAYEITPEGNARLTLWRTLRLYPSDSREAVTLAADEVTVDIDHDATFTAAGVRPVGDRIDQLYERYTMPWPADELRRRSRAGLYRFTPYSHSPSEAELRRYASAPDGPEALVYFMMRRPEAVARIVLADSEMLRALARNDDAAIGRAVALIADPELRHELLKALSGVVL